MSVAQVLAGLSQTEQASYSCFQSSDVLNLFGLFGGNINTLFTALEMRGDSCVYPLGF